MLLHGCWTNPPGSDTYVANPESSASMMDHRTLCLGVVGLHDATIHTREKLFAASTQVRGKRQTHGDLGLTVSKNYIGRSFFRHTRLTVGFGPYYIAPNGFNSSFKQ